MRPLPSHLRRHGRPSHAAILLVLATLSAAIGALSSGVFADRATELQLVSTAWPPFTGAPGQPRFALDLVEEAFSRIGVRATSRIVEPAQFTPTMLEGDVDGSAAAWKDADRERVLHYSEPYLENRLILVGRKGADVSAPTLGALKGTRIAIVEGYSYGDIDYAGPAFVRTKGEEDSLARLLAGTVDYVLMDELVVQYIGNNHPNEAHAKLQLGWTALITRRLHVAIRRSRPDGASLITQFNAQLRGMIADRTYHRLLHVSWIRADVNGDGVPEYVPQSDQAGTAPPERAYSLFALPKDPHQLPDTSKPGFYVGGTIYTDWASVPSHYRVPNPSKPADPSRSTATLFKFVW
jgi:polar amino acid transport system substrate-binding protein